MIIYNALKSKFVDDVFNGTIADDIDSNSNNDNINLFIIILYCNIILEIKTCYW